MRVIDRIIIHCSDSDIDAHDDISVIRKWHSQNGWSGADGIVGTDDDVGYNAFIKKNGKIQFGRPVQQIGAHTKGYNKISIGVCISGRSEFTEAQIESLTSFVRGLMYSHSLTTSNVFGHYELDKNKTCPNFNMDDLRRKLL